MRNRIKSAFLAIVLLGAAFGEASATTLNEALIQAYQTHPSLRAAQAGLRAGDEGVVQANAALKPVVSLTGSADRSFDLTHSTGVSDQIALQLNTSLLLYDGGQSAAAVEVARMEVQLARHNLRATEQQVLYAAAVAFMDVLTEQRFVTLSRNNVEVLRQQVQAAEDRFDVGEATRTDVALAKARLAAAQSSYEFRQAGLKNAQSRYAQAVGGRPMGIKTPQTLPALPKSAASAEEVGLAEHPRILQARVNIDIAEANLERQNRNRSLRVTGSAYARVQDRNNGYETTSSAGIGLSGQLPIYQGGMLSSLQRQAEELVSRREYELQYAALVTTQAVGIAYANYEVAQAGIQARREQVRAAQLAYDGVVEERRLGARTTLDQLNAEQELLDARVQLVSAERDAHVAAYAVLAEMGRLTVSDLNLGIESYNPQTHYESVTEGVKPFDERRGQLLERLLNR